MLSVPFQFIILRQLAQRKIALKQSLAMKMAKSFMIPLFQGL
jgi:hypothetical protein